MLNTQRTNAERQLPLSSPTQLKNPLTVKHFHLSSCTNPQQPCTIDFALVTFAGNYSIARQITLSIREDDSHASYAHFLCGTFASCFRTGRRSAGCASKIARHPQGNRGKGAGTAYGMRALSDQRQI